MKNIDPYLENVRADAHRARGEAMGHALRWVGEHLGRRFRRRTKGPAIGA